MGDSLCRIAVTLLVVLLIAAGAKAADPVSDSTANPHKLSLPWGAPPDSGSKAENPRPDTRIPERPRIRLVFESAIPPITAQLGFDSVRTFSYLLLPDSLQTTVSTGATALPWVRGATAIPVLERITPITTRMPADSGVISLVANWTIKNPNAPINRRDIPPYQKWLSLARVDRATGQILLMTRTNLAHPKTIDTLATGYWDFSRTLWYIYGRWMLHLSDDFSYECVRQSPFSGAVRTTMSVRGREIIDGRECFIVEIQQGTSGHPSATRTYWIDAEERVAQQLKIGSNLFKRVKTGPTPSEETSPSP